MKLTDHQMAEFAARGCLRFDALVPEEINQQFLTDIGAVEKTNETLMAHYAKVMQSSSIPLVPAGTPLQSAYPEGSALEKLLHMPEVADIIESLVGLDCVVDHHFLHITFPLAYHNDPDKVVSQAYHQDSTIDPRQAFDVQMFYFPHEVTLEMGGTRYLPGSQFRIVSEAAIARYQNIRGQEHVVCPAGTLCFFHMGLWHGGGINRSEQLRYMFKTRLAPTKRQLNLWRSSSTPNHYDQRPIFWTNGLPDPEHLHSILVKHEPWFEADTGRLEFINRIRFWRYITGDENFDADYWVTRIENEYAP